MTQIRIKPADGLIVRKPDTELLKKDGETVTVNSYWQRRLNQGDVVIMTDEQVKK